MGNIVIVLKFVVGIIKILLLVGYFLENGFSECLMKY